MMIAILPDPKAPGLARCAGCGWLMRLAKCFVVVQAEEGRAECPTCFRLPERSE